MVSTTESKRSWHGTSVQCVQPMPESITIPVQEMHRACQVLCVHDQDTVEHVRTASQLREKHSESSPTMSPALKQVEKRRRTLREHFSPHTQTQVAGGKDTPPDMFANMHDYLAYETPRIAQFTIRSFQVFPEEESCLAQLRQAILQYMIINEVKSIDVELPGLTSFLSAMQYSNDQQEESNVVYVDIVSLPADSKETVLRVLKNLHTTFILNLGFRWLIVVGDAKTYDILQSLRRQYGSEMQWLLPFPGDWHILYNYQKVLLKIYGEAGLLQLARVGGHRAETLTSLALASHFKRTHHFILQSFEALYRLFLRKYLDANSSVAEVATSTANTLANTLASLTNEASLQDFHEHLDTYFSTTLHEFTTCFGTFMDSLCKQQTTCKFWYEYLTINSLIYMSLFVAIRNGDWMLRMAAIKSMAAVFSAFDRPIYQRLVPQHLADLLCFPAPVLEYLKKGAFSVRLTKSNGHAVGIDKAHEMKINKDAKFAVVRPSQDMMEKTANFMPFRAKCLNNLKHHLSMEREQVKTLPISTSRDHIADTNIMAMLDFMEESDMLPTSQEDCGLTNPLTNTAATPEQTHSLLNFRQIGQTEFENHVSYLILHTPSTDAPCRRKRLQTFGSTKKTKKNSNKLKEIKKSNKPA